ncbi:hypothetical protein [Vibrio phage phiKT1024]|nr:hypothetical protein [Vibrio phage phiKT1024]
MKKNDIFELYQKVQNGDKESIDLLIELHRKKYPRSTVTYNYTDRKKMLHTAYLHLYR